MKELTLKRNAPVFIEKVTGKTMRDYLTYLHHEKGLLISEITDEINRLLEENNYGTTITYSSVKRWMDKFGVEKKEFDRSAYASQLNKRRWKTDEEYREKMRKVFSEASKRRMNDPEVKERQRNIVKNYWKENKEFRERHLETLRQITIARWKDPEYRKKMSDMSKRVANSPEMIELARQKAKRYWTQEKREQFSQKLREMWKNPEYKRKMKEMSKNLWKDKKYRTVQIQHILNRWKNDEEYREKMLNLYNVRTTIELFVEECLLSLGILDYKSQYFLNFGKDGFYVVDYLIGKKVIEAQGDFWHVNPDVYDYKNLTEWQKSAVKRDIRKYEALTKHGYEVLYLWEKDINERPEWCKEQIKEFLGL